MWKRRSLDIPFDCNMNDDSEEAETPAPPPSPEFSGYNGSPYPTPCHTRQQPYVNLGVIAEEEGCADEVEEHSSPAHITFFPRYSDMGQFSKCKDAHTVSYSSVGFNESFSILSNMDDGLVENTARLSLVPVVTCRETVEASVDMLESCNFSRLISEGDFISPIVKTVRCHDSLLSKSTLVGDLERQYGRQKVDQALGDPIRFRNVVEICNEDCSKASTEREVCASGLLIKSRVPSSQGVPCDGVAIPSTSGILFPIPTTTLGKFHSKLKTVSPVVNLGGEKPSALKVPEKPLFHGSRIPKLCPPRNAKKSPLKPFKVVSPCKRPLGYNTIVSPVGAYIHNTPSPALVTNVKPKLCRAATPKRAMVGRGATVMPRHDFASAIAKTHLEIPYKVEERGTENVNTSNIRPILPIVSYSSVPSVILEEPQLERMPRLNKKMKKLLDAPKPRVFRHEGRVKVVPSPRTRNANAASRAVTSDADGDISVVVEKQVTRSNTLGV